MKARFTPLAIILLLAGDGRECTGMDAVARAGSRWLGVREKRASGMA